MDKSQEMFFYRVLGEQFYQLPKSWQAFHTFTGEQHYEGRAQVARGKGFANLIASIMGLPKAGGDVRVILQTTAVRGGERWQRQFGSSCFETILYRADNAVFGYFYEQFGPLRFSINVSVKEATLEWQIVGWSFFGLPLPRFFTPISETIEFEDELGSYSFDIDLKLKLFGRLIAYKGWLVPK